MGSGMGGGRQCLLTVVGCSARLAGGVGGDQAVAADAAKGGAAIHACTKSHVDHNVPGVVRLCRFEGALLGPEVCGLIAGAADWTAGKTMLADSCCPAEHSLTGGTGSGSVFGSRLGLSSGLDML
jgi:hypothetical protein